MKKYLLIIPILLTFIILNSCQDEVAPTDCGCVKIVYDTATFDLSGSVNTINKFDERNYYVEDIDDRDSIKVTLYKNDKILNETYTNNGSYNFEKLEKKAIYKLTYEKDGFISIDTILKDIKYTRRKIFDYEIVKHTDYCDFSKTILQTFVPPSLKSITGALVEKTNHYGDGIPKEYYYTLYFEVHFNEPRGYQKAIVSLSTEPNFEQSKCIIFNEEMKPYNDSTIHSGNSKTKIPTFKKGDKVYIRAYPVKNGVYRNKDSKELGEAAYYELEAK